MSWLPDRARRMGFGSALVSAVSQLSSTNGRTTNFVAHLEVRESNVELRKLYEKFGFRLDNRRSGVITAFPRRTRLFIAIHFNELNRSIH